MLGLGSGPHTYIASTLVEKTSPQGLASWHPFLRLICVVEFISSKPFLCIKGFASWKRDNFLSIYELIHIWIVSITGFGYLYSLVITNDVSGTIMLLCICVCIDFIFMSFGWVSKSVVVEYKFMFNFLRSSQTIFPSVCAVQDSKQQWVRDFISPLSQKHPVLAIFIIACLRYFSMAVLRLHNQGNL